MGRQWREAFPGAGKVEIRRFLGLFVDAFGFNGEYKLQFQPSDRILDVYQATTPKWGVDELELETLAVSLEKAYRFDPRPVWRDDLTLGELFGRITGASAS